MTRMTVNGQPLAFSLDPQTPLLWALRDAMNLVSAKYGCDDGSCHACTVLVDGQPVRSCDLTIARAEGAVVTTVEGLPADHPLFAAWESEQVSQGGFVDPGFICALAGLLTVNAVPARDELATIPNAAPAGEGLRIARAAEKAAQILRSSDLPSEQAPSPNGFSLGTDSESIPFRESNE